MERLRQQFRNNNKSEKDLPRRSQASLVEEDDESLIESLAKSFIKTGARHTLKDREGQRGLEDSLKHLNNDDLRKLGAIVMTSLKKNDDKASTSSRYSDKASSRTSRNDLGRNYSRERPKEGRRTGSGGSKAGSDKHLDRGRRRTREQTPDITLNDVMGLAEDYFGRRKHQSSQQQSSKASAASNNSSYFASYPSPHPLTPRSSHRLSQNFSSESISFPPSPPPTRHDKSTAASDRRRHKPRKTDNDVTNLRDELEEMSNTLTYLNTRSPEHKDCEFYNRFVTEAGRLQLAIGWTLGRIKRMEEEREEEEEARRRYRS